MIYKNLFVSLFHMFFILCLSAGCGSQNNLLGGEKSSSDYNTIIGNPPTTPFAVSIEKGTTSGPCSLDQQDLTIDNSICFDVVFDRQPSVFNSSSITLTQPGSSASINISTGLDPLNYAVRVQNYNTDGTDDGEYSIDISENAVLDIFGNGNLAATSSDNVVEVSQYVQRAPNSVATSGGALALDSCQGLDLQVWSQTGLSSLNNFFSGSPGLPPTGAVLNGLVDNLLNADHLEFRPSAANYVFRWIGFIEIKTAGNYRFRTTSDDGSRFYINGALAVNNDGLHGNVTVTSSNIALAAGRHAIELQFFERTGGHNIQFTYSGPDTSSAFVSPVSESFQPVNCPAVTSIDTSMIGSYYIGESGFNQDLVGLVRDDSIEKHIKVNIDSQNLIKISTGSDVDGSSAFSTNSLSVLTAHNGATLNLVRNMGLTTFGNALLTMDRVWRLECNSLSDLVTVQIPSSSIDSGVNSIVFSSDNNFTMNIKNIELNEISGQKIVVFNCSELSSNIQYFTFGQYNL